MLGQQGVGKSSIANSLLGFDNLAEVGKKKKNRLELPFAVGHGLKSKTKMTSFSTGQFLGNPLSPNITVVDTPGFKVLIVCLPLYLSKFCYFSGSKRYRVCGGTDERPW